MTDQEYKYFLNDPVRFLNNPQLYTKIKNNGGGLKLLIDIFDYHDYSIKNPFVGLPNGDIYLSKYPNFKGYLPEPIAKNPYLVHHHFINKSMDFVIQDSEAMIIPVYIGFAPQVKVANKQWDGKDLQWCLKISSREGKIIHSSKGDEHRTRKENAYYLQWGPDRCYIITLRDQADLFFTDQLSGCGILVFETPHELIVMHHNRKSWQDLKSSNEEVAKIADSYLAKKNIIKYSFINSSHYNPDECAGVFGIRSNGRWKIYFNKFENNKGKMANRRVTQKVDLNQNHFFGF
jgi:hypothetical protein